MQDQKPSFFDTIEETFIAITLGLMTLVTFINVVLRYLFQSGILWGLEITVFLFAWLVLIGASYGIKKSFHLGIDVLLNILPEGLRKACTLLACLACVSFAALLFKGALDYWLPFIGKRAFLETNDIPMPFFLAWLKDVMNDGEAYEKLPRFIPYFALPLGMGLLLFRSIQASWRILTNKQDLLIAGHEAEEMLDAIKEDATKEEKA